MHQKIISSIVKLSQHLVVDLDKVGAKSKRKLDLKGSDWMVGVDALWNQHKEVEFSLGTNDVSEVCFKLYWRDR